ncbi:MAG: GNAT family N-acetyltransferase [Deltaproteobacteria bacterium]|nr:GNAT family N-acetyltransferase [Deltaproteobacteria bacterium]
MDRGTFSYYQGGYAPEWASKSVGLVLVGETFRAAVESGCARYAFLRGTEGYKPDCVDGARHTEAVRVLPPRWPREPGPPRWTCNARAGDW